MPTYSHSRIETYQNCPRQYKLHYLDKPEIPEFQGSYYYWRRPKNNLDPPRVPCYY
jgi:hypothetical protein